MIHEGSKGKGEMLGFRLYFDIGHNLDGTVVSSMLRPHSAPKENFLVLTSMEWFSVQPKVDSGNRSLENFQEPYRESNPKPRFFCLKQLRR
jgi:hypothetical protein